MGTAREPVATMSRLDGLGRPIPSIVEPQVCSAAQHSHLSRRGGSLAPRARGCYPGAADVTGRVASGPRPVDTGRLMRKTLRMTVRTNSAPSPPPASVSPRARAATRRVPTNLSLPADLVAALDEVAGPRNRSRFVEEALRRAIRREQFRIAGERVAGSPQAQGHPHRRAAGGGG